MAEPIGDNVVDPPAPEPPAEPPDRSFSQADVDRIIAERLARAKTTPPPDYDDLKAKAAKLDELEEANKTELERERARADAADTERDRVIAEAKDLRLRSALVAEAAKPDRKVVDAEAAIALLNRDALEFDDNGNPTNVAEAMDQLLEQRPWLVASDGGARAPGADQGARPGGKNQLTQAQLQTMTPAAIVAAQKEGRLDHVLGVKG